MLHRNNSVNYLSTAPLLASVLSPSSPPIPKTFERFPKSLDLGMDAASCLKTFCGAFDDGSFLPTSDFDPDIFLNSEFLTPSENNDFFMTADNFSIQDWNLSPVSCIASAPSVEVPDVAAAASLASAIMSFPDSFGTTYDQTSPCSSSATPGPIRRRRPKVPVPDDVKQTDKYKRRRATNNAAAARNRELKRLEAQQEDNSAAVLDRRNVDLRAECNLLRTELARLTTLALARVSAAAAR